MAFPTHTHAVARQTSNTTTHAWTLPSGNAAGKLLVLILSYDGTPTVSGLTGQGFSQIGSTLAGSGAGSAQVWAKFTDGSEVSGTWTSSAGEQSVTHALLFSGAHASTPPEIASASDTASGDIDPPALNPSGWDIEDTQWVVLGQTSSNAENDSANWVGPSGWTLIDNDDSASGDDSGVQTRLSYKDEATDSMNPPTIAKESLGSDWGAITIAIRPAGGGGGGGGSKLALHLQNYGVAL